MPGQRHRSSEPVPSFDPAALKRLRQALKLSHDALAERTGTTRPQLIAYEAGSRVVGVDTLVALAAGLEVDPIELTTTRLHPELATLVEIRHAKGFTRKAVAAQAGVAEATWDYVERGKRSLRPQARAVVAALLDVSEDALEAAHQRGAEKATDPINKLRKFAARPRHGDASPPPDDP